MPERTVFVVSDRTGITAEILSHSLLTQFPDVIFHTRALPFVDTPEKVVDAVREINEVADNDTARPLIFATFISPQLFEGIRRARGFFVDLFGTFLKPLEKELQLESSHEIGHSHGVVNRDRYTSRIRAVHYAMDPATEKFPEATHLPTFRDMFSSAETIMFRGAPANVTFFLAVIACLVVWLLLWRTRLGYEIRAFGHSESAAKYAGISPVRITVIAMLISGALAGMMALNTTQGESERLILNATEGAGFIGIAVALMGRSHPFGVFLAAILFGFLFQGGAELALWTNIPRELIVVIQALVILFTGALDNMVRMPLERVFLALRRKEG